MLGGIVGVILGYLKNPAYILGILKDMLYIVSSLLVTYKTCIEIKKLKHSPKEKCKKQKHKRK